MDILVFVLLFGVEVYYDSTVLILSQVKVLFTEMWGGIENMYLRGLKVLSLQSYKVLSISHKEQSLNTGIYGYKEGVVDTW